MFSREKIVANTEIFLTRNELLYIGIQILIGFEQILKQKLKKKFKSRSKMKFSLGKTLEKS